MRIRRHVEPHDVRPTVRHQVDDHPADAKDHAVARERILPRVELRTTRVRRDEVHLANAAPVVLERRDLLRVRRPREDRPVAVRPPGVVRCVTEVLDAVGRQLDVLARRELTRPQVVVLDVGRPLAVRRNSRVRRGTAVRRGRIRGNTRVRLQIALPASTLEVHRDRLVVLREIERLERQTAPVHTTARRRRERRGQPCLIEQWLTRPLGRIDHDKRAPVRHRRPIPQPPIRQPGGTKAQPRHERYRVGPKELLGPGVVLGRELPRLLGGDGSSGECGESGRCGDQSNLIEAHGQEVTW